VPVTLKEFIARLEGTGQFPAPGDFTGMTGSRMFGTLEGLSSDDLRDMYSEGTIGSDVIVRGGRLADMADKAGDISAGEEQQRAIMAQLEREGLGEIEDRISAEPTRGSSTKWVRTEDEMFERARGRVKPTANPGRRARYDYERQPSRPAAQNPSVAMPRFGNTIVENTLPGVNPDPQGLVRGGTHDVHMTTYAKYEPELRKFVTGKNPVQPRLTGKISPKEQAFWNAWDDVPDEVKDEWESTKGFVGRGGEFMSQDEHIERRGRGETFMARDMERRLGAQQITTIGRANSLEEADQVKRRHQTKAVQSGLANLREERAYLERINRANPSENVTAQIGRLTRKIGALGNLARQRGMMGMGWLGNVMSAGETIGNVQQVEQSYGKASTGEKLLRFTERQLGVPGIITGPEEGGDI
jgi:hypothetical protein